MHKLKLFIALLLIAAFGFVIYANAIDGKFIWDDNLLLKDNIYIRSPSGIGKIFTRDLGSGSGTRFGYYRPLQLLSYMLEYRWFGAGPRIYHITNIVLHILAALGVFWLALAIQGSGLFAFLAAMFFVSSPLQTEAVAYISDRADLLCSSFFILSFVFYLKYVRQPRALFYSLMLAGYVFSLLSKETALGFLLILPVYHYAFGKRLNARALLPIAAVTVIYLALRQAALKSEAYPYPAFLPTLFLRLPGFFAAATQYLKLLFFPYGLHFAYGDKIFSYGHPMAIAGAALLILLAIYAVKKKRKDAVISFSCLWFLAMLIPNSGIYPPTAFYMTEHCLYLPLIGFSFILSSCLSRLYAAGRVKGLAVASALAIIIFYGYTTARQNKYWLEPREFYLRTLSFNPDSAEIYYNLAEEYDRSGDKKAAAELYKKAIALDASFDKAYNNLGVIYSSFNRKNEALILFKTALGLNPRSVNACSNLGILYFELGRKDDSFSFFKKAFEINPDYPLALYNLAVAHYYREEYGLAGKYFDEARKAGYAADPDFSKLIQATQNRK